LFIRIRGVFFGEAFFACISVVFKDVRESAVVRI